MISVTNYTKSNLYFTSTSLANTKYSNAAFENTSEKKRAVKHYYCYVMIHVYACPVLVVCKSTDIKSVVSHV